MGKLCMHERKDGEGGHAFWYGERQKRITLHLMSPEFFSTTHLVVRQ